VSAVRPNGQRQLPNDQRQSTVIDSHCHLADAAFDPDLPEVISRAASAGVTQALCILTAGDTGEAERGRRVAALWPEARFAIGVHPHVAGQYAGRAEEADRIVRAAVAANPQARAVGEIGLDYHYDFSPRDVQREVFRRQVAFARDLRLPVVIHTREATADTFAILSEEGRGEVTGVFHCFSGDATMARQALDLGFYVSFAGIVTFPKAETVREAARLVPADRLLVETDAPYLAPVPYRGKRNEPAYVARTVDALARTRGETPEHIARAATGAFQALFRP
jgi:TatD DNase family protein